MPTTMTSILVVPYYGFVYGAKSLPWKPNMALFVSFYGVLIFE